jgi:acetyl esterase/lipase
MSLDLPEDHIAKRTVVYRLPGMDKVAVEPDLVYSSRDGAALTMDVYRPPATEAGAPRPAVVLVAGYPDPGFRRIVGCRFKEMGSTVSWARLLAASGLAAVAYENSEPASDLEALLAHLRDNAASLGIDASRLGLWASSGNVPLALAALMADEDDRLRCAALLYGYTLDVDGAGAVAEAAQAWRFANPAAGRSVEDLPRATPLFIARAGRDETPNLNSALDRFVARALERNLPLTLVNHPDGPHAFDLFDDSETSRSIVRQTLDFMARHLGS